LWRRCRGGEGANGDGGRQGPAGELSDRPPADPRLPTLERPWARTVLVFRPVDYSQRLHHDRAGSPPGFARRAEEEAHRSLPTRGPSFWVHGGGNGAVASSRF